MHLNKKIKLTCRDPKEYIGCGLSSEILKSGLKFLQLLFVDLGGLIFPTLRSLVVKGFPSLWAGLTLADAEPSGRSKVKHASWTRACDRIAEAAETVS